MYGHQAPVTLPLLTKDASICAITPSVPLSSVATILKVRYTIALALPAGMPKLVAYDFFWVPLALRPFKSNHVQTPTNTTASRTAPAKERSAIRRTNC